MSRYIFSGNLTDTMVEMLLRVPWFEPMDVLVSQLDRGTINKMLGYKERGAVKSLFIDSGAYSVYTGKKSHLDVDEYIKYVNGLDEHIYAVAQADTIPGKFGVAKTTEDYIESADKSWENYLYMRKRMKSPEKLIPVFHFGESFDTLRRMLDYRDPEVSEHSKVHSDVLGEMYMDRVNIVGLSPANDSAQKDKDLYLGQCYDFISRSSYPDVKTHLFGMTSLPSLAKFPYYSADSVSHRLRAAYNKIFTRKWGVISLTDKSRVSKTKSNMSFYKTCDAATRKEFDEFLASYKFTFEEVQNDNAARTCIDICETQQAVKNEFAYKPTNKLKAKRLFSI